MTKLGPHETYNDYPGPEIVRLPRMAESKRVRMVRWALMRTKIVILAAVLLAWLGCSVDEFLDSSTSRPTRSQPRPPAGSVECYESFGAFKRKQGTAGSGKHWHHLVNKNPKNEAKFGGLTLHCTDNVIRLDSGIHRKISGWYNSKQPESQGMLVRDWQAQFDWNKQRAYAIKKLYEFGGKLPKSWK